MANFPGSIYSPAAVSAGQTIQPADINNPNAEIAAIESGITGGTAPLNIATLNVTAGSTMATLNVSGGSTLATLSVAGGSTFAGTITFSTYNVTPTPTVHLSNSANQNVNNSAYTGLNWDTEDTDAAGMHSTSANSSRITFAQSTGWYGVGANVEWNGNSSGLRLVRLMLNDATAFGGQMSNAPVGGASMPQSVFGLVRATSTSDYVTASVFQNTGSTLSIQANSTLYGTQFWAFKVTSL